MTDLSPVETGPWAGFSRLTVPSDVGLLSVRMATGTAGTILFNHAILSGSAIWHRQATRLAAAGWTVICLDTRGHGASSAPPAPYAMDDLVRDNVAVLDALKITRVHYVGVSQGGMTGLGLGVNHADRLASLCICAARADAPAPFAAAWDERIAVVRQDGIAALVRPTVERWFGPQFLESHADVASKLIECCSQTAAEGFVGGAQAIQGLDYLGRVAAIKVPTTLIVGLRDQPMVQPMRDLAPLIAGAQLVEIEDAGHLPQLDQPEAFDRALDAHLARSIGH